MATPSMRRGKHAPPSTVTTPAPVVPIARGRRRRDDDKSRAPHPLTAPVKPEAAPAPRPCTGPVFRVRWDAVTHSCTNVGTIRTSSCDACAQEARMKKVNAQLRKDGLVLSHTDGDFLVYVGRPKIRPEKAPKVAAPKLATPGQAEKHEKHRETGPSGRRLYCLRCGHDKFTFRQAEAE